MRSTWKESFTGGPQENGVCPVLVNIFISDLSKDRGSVLTYQIFRWHKVENTTVDDRSRIKKYLDRLDY